jgi:phage baseplate assembly protein W
MSIGVEFPLINSGKNIGFDLFQEDEISKAVKFNLKNIILTTPGERIWDTSFGVGIKNLLFEQKDFGTIDKYTGIIVGQIESYAPYITLESVDIEDSNENTIKINIKYQINRTEISDFFELEINGPI